MNDQPILVAFKHALAGTLVGTGVAMAADWSWSQVQGAIMPTGQMTYGSAMGRAAFTIVATSAVAAGFIYAGDKIVDMVGGAAEDPLYRLFYYQTAFHAMSTSAMGPMAVRRILSSVGSVPSAPGASSSAPANSPQANQTGSTAPKSKCGGVGGCGR